MRGLALGLVAVLAAGCGGMRAIEADRAYQVKLAAVERVDVHVINMRMRPAVVHVSVYGQFPDSCTKIDRSRQDRLGSAIDVTLTTRRDSSPDCAAEPRAFEQRILLDVVGLPAGLYVVTVNGVQASFQILEDLGSRGVPHPFPDY